MEHIIIEVVSWGFLVGIFGVGIWDCWKSRNFRGEREGSFSKFFEEEKVVSSVVHGDFEWINWSNGRHSIKNIKEGHTVGFGEGHIKG